MSLTTFENARKNNFPSTIAQNISLQKSIASAKSQKAAYIQKLEQERIAEERKRKIEAEKLRAEYSKSICISGKFVCQISMADGIDWSDSPEMYNLTYHKLAIKYAVIKFNANGTAERGGGDKYGRGADFDMAGLYTIVGNTITIDWLDKYTGDDVLTIVGSEIDFSKKCLKTTKFKTKEWVNLYGKRMGGEIFENIEY